MPLLEVDQRRGNAFLEVQGGMGAAGPAAANLGQEGAAKGGEDSKEGEPVVKVCRLRCPVPF